MLKSVTHSSMTSFFSLFTCKFRFFFLSLISLRESKAFEIIYDYEMVRNTRTLLRHEHLISIVNKTDADNCFVCSNNANFNFKLDTSFFFLYTIVICQQCGA